ncbi:MAG: Fic family protein [Nitrospirae bacterium]|nr:Fic family protein [Nitrospirota bacterium]
MQPVIYHINEFPPKAIEWVQLIPLLGPANAALARYDAILKAIPNAQVLLSPLSTQEAVLSSRIEGTQATMGEVLEYEAGSEPDMINPEKVLDIQEVLNYRKAILLAENLLQELPLSGRLLKQAHAKLMEGVRGKSRDPGNFRRIDNFIGPLGCSKEEARFIPIEPQLLDEGIRVWENYLHSVQPDTLVQLGVAHAEFEALHPFLDGNGRLGRMLIPLFLYERKMLERPTFYISAYFETHRDEYYDRLRAISRDGDWTGWCVFFLKALIEQADLNTKKASDIIELYDSRKGWVREQTRSQYAVMSLDFIFKQPIFASSDFVEQSGIPEATAKRILRVLQDNQLLRALRKPSGRRPAILIFPELLNIAEGKEVF